MDVYALIYAQAKEEQIKTCMARFARMQKQNMKCGPEKTSTVLPI